MLTRAMLDQIGHLVRPLRMQVENMVARAVLRLVDDSKALQVVQVDVPETRPDAEHYQPYGFFSVPLPGAEGVAVFPSGDRGHPLVVVMSDRRYRPTGHEPGTAGIHNQDGCQVVVLPDNTIEARSANGTATKLPTLADVQAVADKVNELRTAYNSHTQAVAGGVAGAPVQQVAVACPSPAGTGVFKAE